MSDLFLAGNPNSVFKLFGVGSSGTAPIAIGTTSANFTTACSFFITGCVSSNNNPNVFNGAGFLPNNFFGLDAKPPAPSNGLKDEQSVSFFLTFASAAAATSFVNSTDFELAVHDIGGLTEACGSSKAVFTRDDTPTSASSAPTSSRTCNRPPPVTSTSEPGSAVLMVSGLVAVVGAVRRRRTARGQAA